MIVFSHLFVMVKVAYGYESDIVAVVDCSSRNCMWKLKLFLVMIV